MKIKTVCAAGAAFILIQAYFISAQIIIPRTPLMANIDGNVIIAKLEEGDTLYQKLEQLFEEYNVKQGMVLFGIGQLRNFAVGQYNPVSKRYVTRTYPTRWELVSLQGTLARENTYGGFQANCKATLADSSGAIVAGHLTQGLVSIATEIAILKLTEVSITKMYNVQNGLWELNIFPRSP